MTLDPKILELLDVIVCPACRGELVVAKESLFCAKCQLDYPIRNSIPVLLIDAATKRG